jgi:hypothetical protein
MSTIEITGADFTNSSWNALVCCAPFLTGYATAWAVDKVGRWTLHINGKSSSDALRMKLFACTIGAALSFSVASNMPPLISFSGKKVLQLAWLVLLDVIGVIPGFYGQRSLYVIGFIGAFTGAFMNDLILKK